MPTIHFISGDKLVVDPEEFKAVNARMIFGGTKFVRLKSGDLVSLNSTTIEYISMEDMPTPAPAPAPEPVVEEQVTKSEEIIQKVEEIKATAQDKQKEFINEMIAKSSCTHQPDQLIVMKSGGKKGLRYFKVCSFCGWRDRFMKENLLTEEEKENAPFYQGQEI
jgi:hypothetical protein